MKMNRQFFAAVILCSCCLSLQAEGTQELVIKTNGGQEVCYRLSEQPNITYGATDLVVTVGGEEKVRYDRSQLQKFFFRDAQGTGVDALEDSNGLSATGSTLTVTAIDRDTYLTIHNLGGMLLVNEYLEKGAHTTIPLSHLGTGTFLITLNGKTHKYSL